MAGATLLALLDDIALLMDDVSVMTKVAVKKTAGVLGDDLAVNAEKVTGVPADRELPVVFAVFRGSMLNKAILVPAALVIAAVAEWAIAPLLMAGGLFLCYEGFEKVWHALAHSAEEKKAEHDNLRAKLEAPGADPVAIEKKRIRGAIRTDFILSAEIIVITLGIVGDADLSVRASVLTGIALLMTIGVYGLVAVIVKIDDLGLYLAQREDTATLSGLGQAVGRGLLALAPRLMRTLTVVGTLAMFLVGGGILIHGIPALHHASEAVMHWAAVTMSGGAVGEFLAPQIFALVLGLALGGLTLAVLSGARRLMPARSAD